MLPFLTARRIAVINLLVRIGFLIFVLVFERWRAGDTEFYLRYAQAVCNGDWGGERTRVPMYLWYLCGLSPNIQYPASPALLAIPLLFQTLAVWASGLYFVMKGAPRWVVGAWFFDPVLFAYSYLIHPDSTLAVGVLWLGVFLFWYFNQPRLRFAALSGVLLAFCILTRPVATPLLFWTLAVMVACGAAPLFQKLKHAAVLLLVCGTLLAPRVYWNVDQYHKWMIAEQGEAWMSSLAGALEYHHEGLDFVTAEQKWYREHKNIDSSLVYKTVLKHFGLWAWLNAKGMARTLFGHANAEWGFFILGEAPVGPGWFKVPEADQSSGRVIVSTFFEKLCWLFGVIFCALWCGFIYFRAIQNLPKPVKVHKWEALKTYPMFIWGLGSIFAMAFLPQIFGDSRFRLAIWPLILLLGFMHLKSTQKEIG
jgi:hypothetical protein